MRRSTSVLLAAALLHSVFVGSARADWQTRQAQWHSFWHRVKVDTHRNNAWPEPFRYQDRQTVYAHYAAQAANGWQRQTTLGHQYFDHNTHELNEAGIIRLHWIATRVPENRRTVYVLQTYSPKVDRARHESIELEMTRMLPSEEHPAIVRTKVAPPTFNADMLDKMWEMHKSTVPPPVLPAGGEGGGP